MLTNFLAALMLFAGIALGFALGYRRAPATARPAAVDDVELAFALEDMARMDYLSASNCDVMYETSVGFIVVPAIASSSSEHVVHLATGETLREAIDEARKTGVPA